jgi:hypothetical protein
MCNNSCSLIYDFMNILIIVSLFICSLIGFCCHIRRPIFKQGKTCKIQNKIFLILGMLLNNTVAYTFLEKVIVA